MWSSNRYLKDNVTFDDSAILISEKTSYDRLGNEIIESTGTEVMCNIDNVTRSHFYSASNSGYKIDFVLTVNDFEYSNERKVKIENVIYEVIRTYKLDGDLLEVTLGEKIGDRK